VRIMRRTLIFALILVGFTSVVSQTLLIREFLISFYGNELSVGVILASWLFWVTVGSWGLGRLADRLTGKVDLFILHPETHLANPAVRNYISQVEQEFHRSGPGRDCGLPAHALLILHHSGTLLYTPWTPVCPRMRDLCYEIRRGPTPDRPGLHL